MKGQKMKMSDDQQMSDDQLCESCILAGKRVVATGHSSHPDWAGYWLCDDCIAEYDSRAPIAPLNLSDSSD